MLQKVPKDPKLARNMRNYLEKNADLGQITKFVASLESLFAQYIYMYSRVVLLITYRIMERTA